jgi:hypothetical protein
MSTLILILLSTYAQYQPYTQSPTRYINTLDLIDHNPSNTVAIKFETMDSNTDKTGDKTPALPGPDWLTVARKPKSPPTQRSASRVASKSGKKAPKHPPSKRLSTGLHTQESDISIDRQKKKTPLPLDKINGDIRNMFTVTGTGPVTTLPYVPQPIHVTKLMQTVTKKAASRSISPKNRTVDADTVAEPPKPQADITTTIKTTPTTTTTTGKHAGHQVEKTTNATITCITNTIDKPNKNTKSKKTPITTQKHKTILPSPKMKTATTIQSGQQGSKDITPEKQQLHPTRRFPIPTVTETIPKTKGGGTVTNPPLNYSALSSTTVQTPTFTETIPKTTGGGTATNLQVTYTARLNTVQSPMRSTPFTTPVAPKAAIPPWTLEKFQFSRTNDQTRQVLNPIPMHPPATYAPATSTEATIPPVHLPTDPMPPIQHYVNTQLEQTARNEETVQDLTTPSVVQLNDTPNPPHISEPPVGLEDFPMPDDQDGAPEHTDVTHQESDEGYATAVDDEMASETDKTAGSRSEGSTTRGMDDQSVGASTYTQDSRHSLRSQSVGRTSRGTDDRSVGASNTYSRHSSRSQSVGRSSRGTDDQSVGASTNTHSRHSSRSQSVGQTSLRSESSGDDTNATDLTAATPPRNNRTDMDCDSDDDEATEDLNLVCPHPEHFKTFWRADFITSIPANTNPILAVAVKLGETLQILQTIDKDTSVYPYESNPKLKPICDPAAFQTLGTELYSYADKNNLWKYLKNEMKTCRLILCLAMNSDFRSTCDNFNRTAEDSQLYPRALNYPRIGRAGFFPMSHPHQMSEALMSEIKQELKRPVGLEWRKAVPSIDLSDNDAKPGTNG